LKSPDLLDHSRDTPFRELTLTSRHRVAQPPFPPARPPSEISGRNCRVQALQKRWDRLRAGLDLILDQRGAEMADMPGGASGMLVRDCRGKGADKLVTRIDLGVVSLVAELRVHGRRPAQELGQWKAGVEECKALDVSPGTFRCHRRPRNQAPERAHRGAPKVLGPAARRTEKVI
jgi:hypothetical protein